MTEPMTRATSKTATAASTSRANRYAQGKTTECQGAVKSKPKATPQSALNSVRPNDEKQASSPVPYSLQPAGNDFAEPPAQFYEAALRHRRVSLPDVTEAGMLTHTMKAFLKGVPSVTVEAVTAQLLAYAAAGLDAVAANRSDAEATLEALTVRRAENVIRACEYAADVRIRKTRTVLMKRPENRHDRETWIRARSPEVIARLTGRFHSQPWDAAQDGHLLTREAARAIGIVRWAHAETAERRERVIDALSKTLGFGPGHQRIWSDRRPVIVIDKLSVYTVKLVTDAWSYDPSVAVIYTGEKPLSANPFDVWDIPIVCDTRGWLRALLAIETAPCVIEPRLGGFTVTAATGYVDPKCMGKHVKVPAWIRTLAEIGLLAAYDRVAGSQDTPVIEGPAAQGWHSRYQALLSVTRACDYEIRHGRSVSVVQLEALSVQRRAFIDMRNHVVGLMDRLAHAGREIAKADAEREAAAKATQEVAESTGSDRSDRGDE